MSTHLFQNVYVEKDALAYPLTHNILEKLERSDDYESINNYDLHFSRTHKPYWNRRGNLNLFLAIKKGDVVKLAPPAYGAPTKGVLHYYFVHAYNCIYACHYCYLQGYFNSSDIVMFVNREEILKTVKNLAMQNAKKNITSHFYSGEFSDSLALSEISGETIAYLPFFESLSEIASLELRTKSVAISALEKYANKKKVPNNVVVAYSLSSEAAAALYDEKAPSINARLKAISTLLRSGYRMAFHLDPIVFDKTEEILLENYSSLLEQLGKLLHGRQNQLAYVSLGMLRFTKSSFKKAKTNHFFSPLWRHELNRQTNDFDSKMRYEKSDRLRIFSALEKIAANNGIPKKKIYRCMED